MDKLTELPATKFAVPEDSISNSLSLSSLPIKPLDYIKLMLEIEEAYDIKTPLDMDNDIITIAELSDAIAQLKNSASGFEIGKSACHLRNVCQC